MLVRGGGEELLTFHILLHNKFVPKSRTYQNQGSLFFEKEALIGLLKGFWYEKPYHS